MSLRKKIITSGVLVGLSQAVVMALSFGRNVIIGRMVSIPDMGIAATIALALQIIESASDINVNLLMIRSKDGDDPQLQSTAQTFMALRGLITAIILVILGGPLAQLFNVPQAAWAFRMMALAPLIRGFVHQDLWRYHRAMKFGPLMRVEIISQAVALLAAWPLAKWLGNYSVMLWVILIQVVVVALLSHLANERPYRLGMDRSFAMSILGFGWPLLFNGFLMLFLNFGDRLVIAAFPAYSMRDVGLYMIASSVTFMPIVLLTKLGITILLPVLAKEQDNAERFNIQYRKITRAIGLAAILLTTLLIIAGPSTVVLFFGEKYLPVTPFFGWLAAGAGVRVLKLAPNLGENAFGDSQNTLLTTVARCSGFLIAIVAASLGAELKWLAIAGFLGELISLVVSMTSLYYRRSVFDPSLVYATILLLAATAGSMGIFEIVSRPGVSRMVPLAVASAVGIVTTIAGIMILDPDRFNIVKLRERLVP